MSCPRHRCRGPAAARRRPAARRGALRLEPPAVDRVLVHDAAGHGALPLALVLVPRLARRAVGARARRLARRRQRVPPRAADRRLRRHGRRLDRLLLRQPAHLVRLARAAGHDRARALRPSWTPRPGKSQELAHRRARRGAAARAGARGDDGGREGPRLHLAGAGPGPLPRRGSARRWRERPRATAPRTPRARAPGCATRPSTGTPRLARQTVARLLESQRSLADFRAAPEAARPDRAAAARLPAGVRRHPLERRARDAARRDRAARRCRPTPTSWTARPRARRTC